MAVQAHQDYGMCLPEHHSPSQSPLSASPIPDQSHSPRGNGTNMMGQEHNWYIILEPNGNSNVVHFNSPNGETVASFIANCGDMIEFEPGVFFQVPYPQQPGPMPIQPVPQPIHQPQPMYLNTSAQNIQNSNMIPNGYNSHEFTVNPYCPSHGNANTTNNFTQTNGRAEKRREKLQKKLRDKNQSTCTCKQSMQFNGQNGLNGRMVGHPDGVHILPEDNGYHNLDPNEGLDPEKDMTICIPPKTMAESPYAIILTWDECILNNSHLQGCLFDLQMSDARNKYKSIFSGQSSTFRASELQPGTQYFFRLSASWNNKRGPFSDAVSCTTLQTKPTTPSMLRVIQKTKTAITLKWNAPISDGGSSITSYTLQWIKGHEQGQYSDLFTGLQKQFKHSHKLPPGTQCSFRVLATNEIGSSDWSDVMRCLTSAGPPAAPEAPKSVDCGTNFIRLIWCEPDNNGAPVEEYKLEMEDPNDGYGFISKYHGEKTSYCCQNLRRNTHYTFRLSASNSQGFSRPSPPISYMTLPEAPGKMEKPKVNGKPKTNSISIKWEPPRDSGGNEAISYILEVDDGKGGQLNPLYQGSDREFTLSNLKPGCTYKIRVVSESKAGQGTWSPILQASTLPVCPRNCQPPSCHKAEPNSLQLDWDEPETGGAKISNYVIQMASSSEGEFKQVYTGCKRGCRVTELLPGTDYHFKMQATNQAGTSLWSPVSTLTTAPSPPDAPDVPVVSFKTPTNLRLDWVEPVLHGAEVTSYTVEKLEDDSFHKVYQGTCCFCEIKRNLNPATHYYFRIQAHSTAGDSSYSEVFTVEMPPSVPGPVTEIKVIEQTSNSCLVQWRHPIDHGARVYEYILEATGATSMICTAQRPNPSSLDVTTTSLDGSTRSDRSDRGSTMDGESDLDESDIEEGVSNESIHSEASSLTASKLNDEYMEYRLSGLTADASYRLRIQAVNSVGTGLFSHPIQFFTKELPPSPPTLTASSISHHGIKLKWGNSSTKKSLSVLNHCLQLQNKSGSFSQVYDGMSTSYTINKLNELTPYCCRIRSKNDAGEGDFSQPKIFYTKARPPPTIKDLECANITNTSLNITWSPIEKKLRPDDVMEYRLQMLDQETGKDFKQVYQGPNHSYEVKDLKPESSYSFRVHAVRYLSESARTSTPTSSSEIKGAFSSPLLRAKTLSEKAMEESVENENLETTPQEDTQTCKLTDTHIALIILSTFLIICALIAGILRWVLNEAQL